MIYFSAKNKKKKTKNLERKKFFKLLPTTIQCCTTNVVQITRWVNHFRNLYQALYK